MLRHPEPQPKTTCPTCKQRYTTGRPQLFYEIQEDAEGEPACSHSLVKYLHCGCRRPVVQQRLLRLHHFCAHLKRGW